MNKLITLDEAAEYLRKTPAQLRWMRHAGTGPKSAKIGGRVMYRQKDVDDWIDAQFDAEAAAAS